MKVLLADDSLTTRRGIRRSLREIGIEDVIEAESGADLIAKFRSGEFGIVVTDWNMPGEKTAFEAVKKIRALDASVPIIMIIIETGREQVPQAVQASVSDYLVKPFTADTLREKLEKCGFL